MEMNVFSWPFTRRYILRHPFRMLGLFFRKLGYARQRVRKGWCDDDLTDLYNWIAYVFCGLLDELACEEELLPDNKAKWLSCISSDIRYALTNTSEEDKCDREMKAVYSDGNVTAQERAEAAKRLSEKKKEIVARKREMIRTAFSEFGDGVLDVWRS